MRRTGRTASPLAAAALAAVLVGVAAAAAALPAASGQGAGGAPAPLPDAAADPYLFIERYNSEEAFRKWYDSNYGSVYESVYEAAGVPEPAPFVEEGSDPQSYVDRYNSEDAFREWYDGTYSSTYKSIYEAVGLPSPGAPAAPAAAPSAPAAPAAAPSAPAAPAAPPFEAHPDFAPYVDDPSAGPYSYVERYRSDDTFRKWFDGGFGGMSIYEAVGVPDPAPFAADADPQELVERYENERAFREWFDGTHGSEYESFHAAVGLPAPVQPPPFVDPKVDPRYYVARHDSEPEYRAWFEKNYPGMTIYEAVGLDESEAPGYGECGIGTSLVGGECVPARPPPLLREGAPPGGDGGAAAAPAPAPAPEGGGCLVATAAHGTELAPQVQALREIRDGALLGTAPGASFMAVFNEAYYSFSPAVADMERESPALRAAVAALLAPMLASLSLMSVADPGSPGSVLAAGILVIALNVAAYVGAPAAAATWAAARARRARAAARRPLSSRISAGAGSDGKVV